MANREIKFNDVPDYLKSIKESPDGDYAYLKSDDGELYIGVWSALTSYAVVVGMAEDSRCVEIDRLVNDQVFIEGEWIDDRFGESDFQKYGYTVVE